MSLGRAGVFGTEIPGEPRPGRTGKTMLAVRTLRRVRHNQPNASSNKLAGDASITARLKPSEINLVIR